MVPVQECTTHTTTANFWSARSSVQCSCAPADCLADMEAGMGLSYPPDTELAQRCCIVALLLKHIVWLTACY